MTPTAAAVQKDVFIILAGTGLEAIRYQGRVGTDPGLSRLARMGKPDLKKLHEEKKITDEVLHAVENGTYSKVLMTNARMLFHGVIPLLELDYFKEDGAFEGDTKKQRLMDRLVAMASFLPYMDYGPRFYVNQNSVGALGEERFKFLHQAFLYHLVNATANPVNDPKHRTVLDNMHAELERFCSLVPYDEFLKSQDETTNIFSSGLANRDFTSPALKLLSCLGLTSEVRVGFGNEFEELTALHFIRYMQVQGYGTCRITLRFAWSRPAAWTEAKCESTTVAELEIELDALKEQEVDNIGVPKTVVESLRKGECAKHCVVYSLGGPSSQSGDLFALVINGRDDIRVEPIQCKHLASIPNAEETRTFWRSLGVEVTEDGKSDFAPKEGKAAWSYAGLNKFRELCAERLNAAVKKAAEQADERDVQPLDVKLGTRTLAVSFPMPAKQEMPVPDGDARIWFREMLEPTISVLEPGQASPG